MDVYLGMIMMWAPTKARVPSGWALCDGSLLKIADYQALFTVIGNAYGGDGQTQFALPNFTGRVPIGPGATPLGTIEPAKVGGSPTATLSVSNMPQHVHKTKGAATVTGGGTTVNATANNGTSDTPSAGSLIGTLDPGGTSFYTNDASNPVALGGVTTTPPKVDIDLQSEPAGLSLPFPIMQPYLPVRFIIAVNGRYPGSD